jgi:hypothetical protein
MMKEFTLKCPECGGHSFDRSRLAEVTHRLSPFIYINDDGKGEVIEAYGFEPIINPDIEIEDSSLNCITVACHDCGYGFGDFKNDAEFVKKAIIYGYIKGGVLRPYTDDELIDEIFEKYKTVWDKLAKL